MATLQIWLGFAIQRKSVLEIAISVLAIESGLGLRIDDSGQQVFARVDFESLAQFLTYQGALIIPPLSELPAM